LISLCGIMAEWNDDVAGARIYLPSYPDTVPPL
jgi:hypothetical protein